MPSFHVGCSAGFPCDSFCLLVRHQRLGYRRLDGTAVLYDQFNHSCAHAQATKKYDLIDTMVVWRNVSVHDPFSSQLTPMRHLSRGVSDGTSA